MTTCSVSCVLRCADTGALQVRYGQLSDDVDTLRVANFDAGNPEVLRVWCGLPGTYTIKPRGKSDRVLLCCRESRAMLFQPEEEEECDA